MFKDFETQRFPVDLCTIPNEREPEIRDSNVDFLCVILYKGWSQECNLKVLRPYTCPDVDDPTTLLYGWVDSCGEYVDHRDHDIHGDDDRVVAWKRVDTPVDFRRVFGYGPGQAVCCDCSTDITQGVSYGAGSGSKTGRDGFFRCEECHKKHLEPFLKSHQPHDPHPYEKATDSPGAGSVANLIGAWPCRLCGNAETDPLHH